MILRNQPGKKRAGCFSLLEGYNNIYCKHDLLNEVAKKYNKNEMEIVMNEKIYEQMNWPEIEGLVYSESDNPHALLGGSLCRGGFLVQVFRPDAVEVSLQIEGKKKSYPMEKVDEAGYFAAIIPGKKKYKYTINIENVNGKKESYVDPYAFEPKLNKEILKKFNAGTLLDAYKFFGAHVEDNEGISGVNFNVWAPNALRVSVVGEFNNWDGRINPMSRIEDTGIFSIFIPGLKAGDDFKYEIKTKDRRILLKSDPYSRAFDRNADYASVIMPCDDEIEMVNKESADALNENNAYVDKPLAIYEIDYEDFADYSSLSKKIEKASKMGFTHVEFMPVCEYCNNDSKGYETLGYYSVTHRIGGIDSFEKVIDMIHELGMKVIVDWNFAFMDRSQMGLYRFDGTQLYELQDTSLYNHPETSAATFDYSKPQVKSFILSAVMFWIKKYKVDGFRFGEMASLLYLDYGKNPGEWRTNIYGGNQNLSAIELIKQLRNMIKKYAPDVLLFAQESSGWPKVTCGRDEAISGDGSNTESLGFDYEWNINWSDDMLSFIGKDPLFRKADYEKLTYGMLYNYSENYCLELSHEMFSTQNLWDYLPGNDDENKISDMKLVYGFLYSHPGKKLVNSKQCIKVEKYLEDLNMLYHDYPQLYELDGETDGFEWVDNCSANETVVAFFRKSTDDGKLLFVFNFTPVKREKFAFGVAYSGKYKKIFESTLKDAYLQKGFEIIKSEEEKYNGADNKLEADIEPLSMSVYEYVPYTDFEIKENEIIREAKIAKSNALIQAQKANALKEKAEKEAQEAFEAQQRAREAANEAWRAKVYAEKQAKLAEEENQKIEVEMKKKLEELQKLKNKK